MQLSYRGASYTFTQKQLSVTESNTYATFRGRRYCVRHAQPMLQSLPATELELIYRGVKYIR